MTLVVVVPGPHRPIPDTDPSRPGDGRVDPAQRVAGSLASSVRAVRGHVPHADQIAVLDFTDLVGQPPLGADGGAGVAELADRFVRCWWNAATRIGVCEGSPVDESEYFDVERAARLLGESAYFRGTPELPMLEAQTLGRYLTDLKFRHEIRDRTQSAIQPGSKVVLGYGLGALAAYEALCALGDTVSVTFVTLAAPMCGPEEVFARLEPAPRSGQGHWPAAVRRWFNIVAHSDPTAMAFPQLTERFGPGIEDEIIEIRTTFGDVYPYLLDRATGRAVAGGLS